MTPSGTRVQGPDDAPVVVLLHSLATSSALWAPQLPVWSTRFRVLAIDLPGHGASPPLAGCASMMRYAQAVAGEMDRHGVATAALVGLSLGSMVAQAFALAYPQRTRALVLAHGSASTSDGLRGVWEARITAFHNNGFATEAPATIARWFTPEFVQIAPLTMAWIERMIRTTHPQGYVDAIRAIQALDHAERLVDIRCPTLVIAGERDQALPPAAGRSIAAVMPAARFAMLEGAAHLGNVEQACAFTELAGAFLCDTLGPAPYPQ